MMIILSQKIDTESTYSDELFKLYHYPRRYRNQIHTGDVFIYYQGNRYDKSQRYYFGTGKIGNIVCRDEDNYYAELLDVKQFHKKVPIYLPDGGYVEQLGYETVRNKINPPWQSSIRPLSQEAYNYILKKSREVDAIDDLNLQLKESIKNYFVQNDKDAILQVLNISQQIADFYNL